MVSVAPEVVPERMNVSTNPRQTVFLRCNATGIPEPVVSWMKDSDVAIQNNESESPKEHVKMQNIISNRIPTTWNDTGYQKCYCQWWRFLSLYC